MNACQNEELWGVEANYLAQREVEERERMTQRFVTEDWEFWND
jgi:hypothetical protein